MASAVLALFLHDAADGAIILGMILVGSVLGYWQEHGASNALDALLKLVSAKAMVLRDGRETEIDVDEVVPGDVVVLSAGSTIPGDCRLFEARDLFVNEAALTGESFPVEKHATAPGKSSEPVPAARPLDAVFQGTHVVSVNLAFGARKLAERSVIVRRLSRIENFGSMNVLCSDKTGTLTQGVMQVERAVDFAGEPHPAALRFAALNAAFETGFANPIDQALRGLPDFDPGDAVKLDEIPYDYLRKRLSVLVRDGERRLLIVKGAVQSVLNVCTCAESAAGRLQPLVEMVLEGRFDDRGPRPADVGEDLDALAHGDYSSVLAATFALGVRQCVSNRHMGCAVMLTPGRLSDRSGFTEHCIPPFAGDRDNRSARRTLNCIRRAGRVYAAAFGRQFPSPTSAGTKAARGGHDVGDNVVSIWRVRKYSGQSSCF